MTAIPRTMRCLRRGRHPVLTDAPAGAARTPAAATSAETPQHPPHRRRPPPEPATYRRARDETGSMSAVIIWPIAVCLLVVPVLFVVLTIPTWIERQTDATDAARNAARALATADTWDHGVAAANAVAADIARNNGLDPSQVPPATPAASNPARRSPHR